MDPKSQGPRMVPEVATPVEANQGIEGIEGMPNDSNQMKNLPVKP